MAHCELCHQLVPDADIVQHLRLLHPDDYEPVEEWPDGKPVIVDETAHTVADALEGPMVIQATAVMSAREVRVHLLDCHGVRLAGFTYQQLVDAHDDAHSRGAHHSHATQPRTSG